MYGSISSTHFWYIWDSTRHVQQFIVWRLCLGPYCSAYRSSLHPRGSMNLFFLLQKPVELQDILLIMKWFPKAGYKYLLLINYTAYARTSLIQPQSWSWHPHGRTQLIWDRNTAQPSLRLPTSHHTHFFFVIHLFK
jgi:hypothetical protein